MSDIAIRAENLSKIYKIGEYQGNYKTLGDVIVKIFSAPIHQLFRNPQSSNPNPQPDTIWALKDVSFEVKRGEVVGIIGRNGAGKTTLLKVLSRITEPTKGQAEIRGRVGSLLEVGTGFHPELTGRENIYLNGAILGMKKDELNRKFDEIIAFAEIEKFIDTPVKRYSSGMYVRLAFAVAAHLEPEILLVDEVLAVGDAAFQRKCLGKMGDVAKEGRTVLFVSHNVGAVRRLCEKTIWIDNGRVVAYGNTDSTVDKYLSSNEQGGGGEFRVSSRDLAPGDRRVRLLAVSVKNQHGEVTDTVTIESGFNLELEYELTIRMENLRVGYRVIASDGTVVFSSADTDPEGLGISRESGIYVSRCTIPGNLLNSGLYYVTVACDRPMQEKLFFAENIVSFTVQLTGGVGGSVPDGRLGILRPLLKWDIYRVLHRDV
jgi:lipopolysaccharide transport system ATP-binding protein